jgi:predicted RNA-binding Zn-ribbon protein involved in translation (DUF1610 family)
MPKIPECDRCLFCAHDPHLVCSVHPDGVKGSTCIDFRPDPELEGNQFVDFLDIGESSENSHGNEQWEPEGASYYNGELIIQPRQRWTREQQLELLDTHPIFTGKCPQCSYEFQRDYTARVHWDCPECGWTHDTV